jgi:DNA repair protein RadA/Sms
VEDSEEIRFKTNIAELDRVLGGGLVEGSLVLIGGEPGIGKSTLLLQLCQKFASVKNFKTLYVSGEESKNQIKLRARRLGVNAENIFLSIETDVDAIENAIRELSPNLVIIDSAQTTTRDETPGVAGSASQVRECAQVFMRVAKTLNITVILVGHVTKEGSLAGPKILEHTVDTVLYFEGEKGAGYRIIRAVKNRFGATNEIGVFEMAENGLKEIKNPSEYMLSGRPLNVPGSSATCVIEGARPILTEVQALVCPTSFGLPRRSAQGLDYNRTIMLIAVLEKRAGISLSNFDCYVNIAGGLKISEPSADLAVICALASSYKNAPVGPDTALLGEVGLVGEIRASRAVEIKIAEAAKLGFKQCVVPEANIRSLKKTVSFNSNEITVLGVRNIGEALSFLF